MSVAVRLRRLAHAAGLELPAYATAGAAGLDVRAAVPQESPVEIARFSYATIPTGLVMELPSCYEGQVRPRSGLAFQHGVTVLNAPGTIDSDYRGELKVLLVNLGGAPFVVYRGMRIAQLVVAPVARAALVEVDGLTASARDQGGFGSTGL